MLTWNRAVAMTAWCDAGRGDGTAQREAGLTGVTLSKKYGGLNFPVTVYSMMTEVVSRADASLQNLFGLQSISQTIQKFGSEEQKSEYLPKFASGEYDGAMALTEPDAGSDLQSAQLSAVEDPARPGVWLLNGRKHFITNGCASVLLVLARSEAGTKDARGLSMFIARKCPEIHVRRIEDKLGIHGSPTCELEFTNAPAELVGQRRFGLIKYVMSLMNGARLAICSQAVGLAEAARRKAWDYASQRVQFGKKLCDIPPVRDMLERMDAQVMAGRSLLYETSKYVDLRDGYEERSLANRGDAEAKEKTKVYTKLTALLTPMSKFFTTEMANQVAYDAIQCLERDTCAITSRTDVSMRDHEHLRRHDSITGYSCDCGVMTRIGSVPGRIERKQCDALFLSCGKGQRIPRLMDEAIETSRRSVVVAV